MDTFENLHIVVAMTKNRLIGASGQLPWDLAEDLRLFRDLTLGHSVIMGRKTYKSIGQPLVGRHNIIISSDLAQTAGIEIFATFIEGLNYARTLGCKIFGIGGRGIFREALPLASQLHISWIDGEYTGDTFFPAFDMTCWDETERSHHQGFTRITYHKRQ